MSSFCPKKSRDFLSAAQQGKLDLVKSLSLDPEVDLNRQDLMGVTAFSSVCLQGHVDIVRYLLDFHDNHAREPIDYNRQEMFGWTPFFATCANGIEKVVELLLEDERIDVNRVDQYDQSPLWGASCDGHMGVVKRLLASTREIDVFKRDNQEQKTAVEIARERGAETERGSGEGTEEEFQQRKTRCQAIAALLESYQQDPEGVKKQLRSEL